MRFSTVLASLAALAALSVALPAQATVQRTFVSMAYGNDANTSTNCQPNAPCRFFQAAMSATTPGGEVVVLDSGGYGTVNITQSVSLIAPAGIYGGISVFPGNTGIAIATAGIKVALKGLTINGMGGAYGINMTNGASLLMEKTTISGFTSGTALLVQTAAKVNVVDSIVRDSALGIVAGAGATVSVSGSQVLNNSSEGIESFTVGTPTGVTTTININDTVVSGSSNCVDNSESMPNIGVINATRVTATKCLNAFINESGPAGIMSVSGSTASSNDSGFFSTNGTFTVSGSTASNNVSGFLSASGTFTVSGSIANNNSSGFHNGGGTFVSMGNNSVQGNTTPTVGTITTNALQ